MASLPRIRTPAKEERQRERSRQQVRSKARETDASNEARLLNGTLLDDMARESPPPPLDAAAAAAVFPAPIPARIVVAESEEGAVARALPVEDYDPHEVLATNPTSGSKVKRLAPKEAAERALAKVQMVSQMMALHRVDRGLSDVRTYGKPKNGAPLDLREELKKRYVKPDFKPSTYFSSSLAQMNAIIDGFADDTVVPTDAALDEEEAGVLRDVSDALRKKKLAMERCMCRERLDIAVGEAERAAALQARNDCAVAFGRIVGGAVTMIRGMELNIEDRDKQLREMHQKNTALAHQLEEANRALGLGGGGADSLGGGGGDGGVAPGQYQAAPIDPTLMRNAQYLDREHRLYNALRRVRPNQKTTLGSIITREFGGDAEQATPWVRKFLRRTEMIKRQRDQVRSLEAQLMQAHDIPATDAPVCVGVQTLKDEDIVGTRAWERKQGAARVRVGASSIPADHLVAELFEADGEVGLLNLGKGASAAAAGIRDALRAFKDGMSQVDQVRVESITAVVDLMDPKLQKRALQTCAVWQAQLAGSLQDSLHDLRPALQGLAKAFRDASARADKAAQEAPTTPAAAATPEAGLAKMREKLRARHDASDSRPASPAGAESPILHPVDVKPDVSAAATQTATPEAPEAPSTPTDQPIAAGEPSTPGDTVASPRGDASRRTPSKTTSSKRKTPLKSKGGKADVAPAMRPIIRASTQTEPTETRDAATNAVYAADMDSDEDDEAVLEESRLVVNTVREVVVLDDGAQRAADAARALVSSIRKHFGVLLPRDVLYQLNSTGLHDNAEDGGTISSVAWTVQRASTWLEAAAEGVAIAVGQARAEATESSHFGDSKGETPTLTPLPTPLPPPTFVRTPPSVRSAAVSAPGFNDAGQSLCVKCGQLLGTYETLDVGNSVPESRDGFLPPSTERAATDTPEVVRRPRVRESKPQSPAVPQRRTASDHPPTLPPPAESVAEPLSGAPTPMASSHPASVTGSRPSTRQLAPKDIAASQRVLGLVRELSTAGRMPVVRVPSSANDVGAVLVAAEVALAAVANFPDDGSSPALTSVATQRTPLGTPASADGARDDRRIATLVADVSRFVKSSMACLGVNAELLPSSALRALDVLNPTPEDARCLIAAVTDAAAPAPKAPKASGKSGDGATATGEGTVRGSTFEVPSNARIEHLEELLRAAETVTADLTQENDGLRASVTTLEAAASKGEALRRLSSRQATPHASTPPPSSTKQTPQATAALDPVSKSLPSRKRRDTPDPADRGADHEAPRHETPAVVATDLLAVLGGLTAAERAVALDQLIGPQLRQLHSQVLRSVALISKRVGLNQLKVTDPLKELPTDAVIDAAELALHDCELLKAVGDWLDADSRAALQKVQRTFERIKCRIDRGRVETAAAAAAGSRPGTVGSAGSVSRPGTVPRFFNQPSSLAAQRHLEFLERQRKHFEAHEQWLTEQKESIRQTQLTARRNVVEQVRAGSGLPVVTMRRIQLRRRDEPARTSLPDAPRAPAWPVVDPEDDAYVALFKSRVQRWLESKKALFDRRRQLVGHPAVEAPKRRVGGIVPAQYAVDANRERSRAVLRVLGGAGAGSLRKNVELSRPPPTAATPSIERERAAKRAHSLPPVHAGTPQVASLLQLSQRTFRDLLAGGE